MKENDLIQQEIANSASHTETALRYALGILKRQFPKEELVISDAIALAALIVQRSGFLQESDIRHHEMNRADRRADR